jgi:hypothetical protein
MGTCEALITCWDVGLVSGVGDGSAGEYISSRCGKRF